MSDKYRLRFEKTGPAAYISHLDLMRVMQRSFTRAGYALKYSEGFNPHALISVCLPLSVGCESVCELMDFRMAGDVDLSAIPERLTEAMPEGIRALEVWRPERKITELKWLEIEGRLDYDERDTDKTAAELIEFFSRDELIVTRRTKRGEAPFDLAPHILSLALFPESGYIRLSAVISAQEPTVNPELLTAALREKAPDLAPDFAKYRRIETFDEKMSVFR